MPGLWQSWAALAFAYYRIGDNDLAASMADEAIAISNGARESGFVHYVKAVSLENLGRYDEAVDAANESIRLEDNTDAQELLARIASMKLDSAS
jgi:tetratricopeptide (TPR) repeat protein